MTTFLVSLLIAFAGPGMNLETPQGTVAESADKALPIKSGRVPDGMLATAEGKETTLKAALDGKPTVLIFYRGGWCPFCNRHLADLATVSSDIRKAGLQIVAISPDLPAELAKTVEKDKVDYSLYSDSSADLIKKFGLAFRVDDATIERYKGFNIDLEKASGERHHILPVPAVYVIDAKGQIRYVHADPDYRVRLKGADVLAAAKKALE